MNGRWHEWYASTLARMTSYDQYSCIRSGADTIAQSLSFAVYLYNWIPSARTQMHHVPRKMRVPLRTTLLSRNLQNRRNWIRWRARSHNEPHGFMGAVDVRANTHIR